MIVLSVLVTILYLLVVPFCIGINFTRFFDKKYNTIGNILTIGFITELVIFQLVYLFAYFGKSNFLYICNIFTIAIVFCSIGFSIKAFQSVKQITLPKIGIGFFVFVIINILMVVMRNLYGVNDGDDAYVLGNALTVLTNGDLFRTDYYTGLAISSKSYLRHLLASNPIFIAYLANMTKIHPTILAHRVLGSFYIVLHNVIILNIARLLFDKDEEKEYGYLFASLVAFITIWDFHSYLTDSTFILTRAWQGKSMFCSIIIPFTIEMFLIIGRDYAKGEFPEIPRYSNKLLSKINPKLNGDSNKYRYHKVTVKDIYYPIITYLCIASVAMTPGAIVLFSIFVFILALWTSIATKKAEIMVKTLLFLLVPMIVFGIIYFKYCRILY